MHEVQISPDLKIATAYVRTLVEGAEGKALDALNRNRKYIRGLIAPKLDMKFMPDIRFRIDTALDTPPGLTKSSAVRMWPGTSSPRNEEETRRAGPWLGCPG